MKDDDFKLLRGFVTDGQTNERTDICECRVAFATENCIFLVVSTIPKIVCETLAALGLQEEIPSWKIMDNKGKITVVLHWEKDHPPGQPPSLQVWKQEEKSLKLRSS